MQLVFFFFFKQKTAYEMRISYWSSDVCSSDLKQHLLGWDYWMLTYDYDLFVIGAGSGGVRAARVSAAYGARVAVAEEHRVGGTCVIRGCVPKKLLVYGSHFAEDLQDARRFGWRSEEHTSELQSLMRISYAVFCLKKKKNMLLTST